MWMRPLTWGARQYPWRSRAASLKPRQSLQIVLSGRAIQYATQIRWTLSKAQETAVAVRDLARDEPMAYEE